MSAKVYKLESARIVNIRKVGALTYRYLLLSLSDGCEPANRLYYVDMSQLPRSSKSDALDFTLYDRR